MANNRKMLYWSLQLAGWGAYFGFCATTMLLGGWQLKIVLTWLIVMAGHLAVSHGLRASIRRNNWLDKSAWPLMMRIVGASVLAAIAANLLIAPFPALLRMNSLSQQIGMFRFFIPASFVLFAVWSFAYLGVQYFFRYRDSEYQRLRMQASIHEAELRALKAQINPHFLFNCLNNLRALIAEDPNKARDMLVHLSDLLRYALEAGRRDKVPLSEELDVVEGYLRLEKLQFEDRLSWRTEIESDARCALIPPMLLQQLVENAIKHGISQDKSGGEIVISAQAGHYGLELRVENTGALKESSGNGFGVNNVRERLRLLCGTAASFELHNTGSHRVAATARIPIAS